MTNTDKPSWTYMQPSSIAALQAKMEKINEAAKLATQSYVELAKHHAGTGIPNPDWDPHEHPKDHLGRFVEKHEGTFLFGKAKKAVFTVGGGSGPKPVQVEHDLQPGDKAFQYEAADKSQVAVVQHHTGELTKIKVGPEGKKFSVPVNNPSGPSTKAIKEAKAKLIKQVAYTEVSAQSLEEAKAKINSSKGKTVYELPNGDKITLEKNQKAYQIPFGALGKQTLVTTDGVPDDLYDNAGEQIPDGQWDEGAYKKILDNIGTMVADGAGTPSPQPDSGLPTHPTVSGSTFTHPVSGFKHDLQPGETLFQHKLVPESFLITQEHGDGIKINKNGKASKAGAVALKSSHNYTKIAEGNNAPEAPKPPVPDPTIPETPEPSAPEDVPTVETVDIPDGGGVYTLKPGEKVYKHSFSTGLLIVHPDGTKVYKDKFGDTPYPGTAPPSKVFSLIAKGPEAGAPESQASKPDLPPPSMGWGKATLANGVFSTNQATTYEIQPGDKLYKSKQNNKVFLIQHADGSVDRMEGNDFSPIKFGEEGPSPDHWDLLHSEPGGELPKPEPKKSAFSPAFKQEAAKPVPTPGAPKPAPVNLPEGVKQLPSGQFEFTHPSGTKVQFGPEDSLYQHKTTKESFAVVFPGGEDGQKINKNGKVSKAGNVVLKSLHNYDLIKGPGAGADATEFGDLPETSAPEPPKPENPKPQPFADHKVSTGAYTIGLHPGDLVYQGTWEGGDTSYIVQHSDNTKTMADPIYGVTELPVSDTNVPPGHLWKHVHSEKPNIVSGNPLISDGALLTPAGEIFDLKPGDTVYQLKKDPDTFSIQHKDGMKIVISNNGVAYPTNKVVPKENFTKIHTEPGADPYTPPKAYSVQHKDGSETVITAPEPAKAEAPVTPEPPAVQPLNGVGEKHGMSPNGMTLYIKGEPHPLSPGDIVYKKPSNYGDEDYFVIEKVNGTVLAPDFKGNLKPKKAWTAKIKANYTIVALGTEEGGGPAPEGPAVPDLPIAGNKLVVGGKEHVLKPGDEVYKHKIIGDTYVVKHTDDTATAIYSDGSSADSYTSDYVFSNLELVHTVAGATPKKSPEAPKATAAPTTPEAPKPAQAVADNKWTTPEGDVVKLKAGDALYKGKGIMDGAWALVHGDGTGVLYKKDGSKSYAVSKKPEYAKSASWDTEFDKPVPKLTKPKGTPSKTFNEGDLFYDAQVHQSELRDKLAEKLGLKQLYYNGWTLDSDSKMHTPEGALDLLSDGDLRDFFEESAATLGQKKPSNWNTKQKTVLSKDATRFTVLAELGRLASLLKDPDSDPDEVEGLWTALKPKLDEPGKTFGKDFPWPKYGMTSTFAGAVKSWTFKKSYASLPFDDPDTASHEELSAHATQQGLTVAGGLTKEQLATWVKADLNDPSISNPTKVKEGLATLGKAHVAAAKAQISLKNAKAKQQAQTSPQSPEQKATKKANDAYKTQVQQMATVYKNDFTGATLAWKGDDTWQLASADGTFTELTSAVAFEEVTSAPNVWLPDSSIKAGKGSTFQAKLAAWSSIHGGSPLAPEVDKQTYLKDAGATYVGVMHNYYQGLWVNANLAGDEVMKFQLEEEALKGSIGATTGSDVLHTKQASHPGSPLSPQGKAAHQAISDFLATQPWYATVKAGAVSDLTGSQVKQAYAALFPSQSQDSVNPGPDMFHENPVAATISKRQSIGLWLHYHTQNLPDPTPVAADIKSPNALDTPPGVQPESWALVVAAEQGDTAEVNKLAAGLTPAQVWQMQQLGLDQITLASMPDSVKKLAAWTFLPNTGQQDLAAFKVQLQKAITARGKQGAWNDPDLLYWQSPMGEKIPLAPGTSVYKATPSTYYLVSADGESGQKWSKDYGEGQLTNAPVSGVENAKNGQYEKVLTAPVALKYKDAVAKGLSATEFAWDTVDDAEKEKGKLSVPFPLDTDAELQHFLKTNANVPPYIKNNPDKLPYNVKLLAAWATDGDESGVLQTIEFKLKSGHYAQSQLAGFLNPNTAYFAQVMKGKSSSDDIASTWSSQQKDAAAKALGLQPNDNGNWDTSEIAKGIADLFTPLEVTDSPKAVGLPKDLKLTKVSKTLGGMHSKLVWLDQNGNEWMSKAFPNDPNGAARVDAEHSANQIARLYGFRAPETRTMIVEGSYSYIQHLQDAKGDLNGIGPNDLTDEQLADVMSEHVLDWLVSNHDSNPDNILLDNKGKAFGIDKGQAWRFFPDDKLAVGYYGTNPKPTWYDQFYKQVQSGKIDKERLDKLTKKVLTRAYRMSSTQEEAFHALVEQAMDKRKQWPDQYPSKSKMVQAIADRRVALFDDFLGFYQGLYKKGNYDFEFSPESFQTKKLDDHTHLAVSGALAEDVQKSGIHGKSLMFNSKDLEDSHMLMYTTEASDGSTTLQGKGNVRKDADVAVTKWLKSQVTGSEFETTSSISEPVKPSHAALPLNDQFYSQIVAGAKTVNTHASDGQYNETTLNAMKQVGVTIDTLMDDMDAWEIEHPEKPFQKKNAYGGEYGGGYDVELVTGEQHEAYRSMLVKYKEDIDRVLEAKGQSGKVVPQVTKAEYTPSKGLNTTGERKLSQLYQNPKGEQIKVWDDGTYVAVDTKGQPGKINSGLAKIKVSTKSNGFEEIPAPELFDPKNVNKPTWYHAKSGDAWVQIAPEEWQLTDPSGEQFQITGDGIADLVQKNEKEWQYVTPGKEVLEHNDVTVGQKVFSVTKRKSYGQNGTMNLTDGKFVESGKQKSGYTGYQYDVEYQHPTTKHKVTISYKPWADDVAKAQQGQISFKVQKWEGSEAQVEDVLDTMRTMGMDLSEADEEGLQLFYWRHMYGIVQNRKDGVSTGSKYFPTITAIQDGYKANPTMSPSEELQLLKDSWALSMGQDKVDNADWKPKFAKGRPHAQADDSEFTTGSPHWLRPDYSLQDLQKRYKGWVPAASIGNTSSMADIAQSGYLLSAEERLRMLAFFEGGGYNTSSSDQSNGASGWVFTRQNREHDFGNIYFNPKTALRTTNYAFNSDNFGEIDNRQSSSYFDLEKDRSFTGGNNEMLIKHSLSILSDVAAMKFTSKTLRNQAIERYKEMGITEINGVPIAEVFVTTTAEVEAAVKKAWDIALAEEAS